MKKNRLLKILTGIGAAAGAAAIAYAKTRNDAYNDAVTGGTGRDPIDPDNTMEEFWNRHLKGFQESTEARKEAVEKVRRSLAEADGRSLDHLIALAKSYREKEESGASGEASVRDRERAEYLLKILQGEHK